jgi:integrase
MEKGKKSSDTERNYRSDIGRLLQEVFGKTIHSITIEEIELLDYESLSQYISSFVGVSNSTINRHISTIKSLLKYLKSRNLLTTNIDYLELITLLNNDGIEIEHMPIEIVQRYIDEAGRDKHNAQVKQKLIMLAADQGFRMDEILSLKWSQLVPQGDGVVIKGYGKRNQKFTKKMGYNVYNSLLDLKKGKEKYSERVFAPLSEKNVTDMMTRIKRNLGYHDISYSFHSLRKSATTFAYRRTGDILEAQRVAGHENLDNTRIYLKSIDYGVMGMFSLGGYEEDIYKKVTHDELLSALSELNKDMLHLLNIKINEIQNELDR